MLKQMCTFRCMLQEGRSRPEYLNMTPIIGKSIHRDLRTMDFEKRLDDNHPDVRNGEERENC